MLTITKYNKYLCLLGFILTLMFFVASLPAHASHTSSISPIQICTTGAIFRGSATADGSVGLGMTAQVFDSGGLVATGSTYTYKFVGDEAIFSVSYAEGTFTPGQTILISISDIVGTFDGNHGAATNVQVGEAVDCLSGPPAGNLLDGRINNNQLKDVAAPVAIYCADGNVDVYKIDAETGDGTRIISVAQDEGLPESTQLLGSAQGVELYWLDTGEYQINTTNFEGYPYWINWVGCNSATLVHTYN